MIELIIIAWVLPGIAGSALLAFDWIEEMDMNVRDLIFISLLALLGPVALFLGVASATASILNPIFEKHGDKIIWRKRK